VFDVDLPDTSAITALGGVELVDAMLATSKLDSAVQARRLTAIGELWERRKREADTECAFFLVDMMEAFAAEVGAAVAITSARAKELIRLAETLRDRLPKVAAVFANGAIDLAMVTTIIYRTELIEDADHIAKVDAALAKHAPQWTMYSRKKIGEHIDSWVGRFDPDGVREPRKPADNRYLEIRPSSEGMAGVWGNLHVQDAVVFDVRLDELIATVCSNDPRTKDQLRADAVRALAERQERMACRCGADDCPGKPPAPARDVVIHVLAESSTIDGDSPAPGYATGFGPIAADSVRELKKSARIKPLVIPTDVPAEPGYRPSVALAEFVRLRDLFCRFPGCDCPAADCDIDHTIPCGQPGGLTHPSNLKCSCRKHHLLKTFYVGANGWSDRQLGDGTVIWTSPTGHEYVTKPGGSLYFPVLSTPTGDPAIATPPLPHPMRSVMMPRRARPRTEETALRHAAERERNAERRLHVGRLAHDRWHAKARWVHCRDGEPPPF
jgi:hypothetical protein